MKQKILFTCLFLMAITMNAQFTLADVDGNTYEDGDTISYGVFDVPEASFDFFVTNTTDALIRTRIDFVSAVNANGDDLELCYGLCYTGITIGNTYPPGADDAVEIEAGATTPQGNHIYNSTDGGGSIVEYVFKYYQVDDNGDEIGDSLTLTYQYDPALGVDDANMLELNIASTVISNYLTLSTVEDLNLTVIDMRGKIVKTEVLGLGRQDVNFSDLAAQVYILQFSNREGVSQTVKVVKQ